MSDASTSYPPGTAAAAGLATCHVCRKASPVDLHDCPRCGAALHLRRNASVQKTMALVVTATLLYIPANILPIMTTHALGRNDPSTILGGVVYLLHEGSWPVAVVIFVASVMVPSGKLLALTWLCVSVSRHEHASYRQRTVMYRVTEFIGKWSMTDVFVVSILVGLIQLGGLLSITADVAAVAFAGVVIVTMIAAEIFDPRLIWDQYDPEAEHVAEDDAPDASQLETLGGRP